MKETGIIMSGSHPRDILEGRKTMTRRVIRPKKKSRSDIAAMSFASGKPSMADIQYESEYPEKPNLPCPYGQVSDRLWVKETFALHPSAKELGYPIVFYKARGDVTSKTNKWKPSLFMPRWASRILLEITEIRVERLQEITEEDAKAEGCEPLYKTAPNTYGAGYIWDASGYRRAYEKIWDSLNAKKGYDWDSNPFVWVIAFKILERA